MVGILIPQATTFERREAQSAWKVADFNKLHPLTFNKASHNILALPLPLCLSHGQNMVRLLKLLFDVRAN